MTEPSIHDLAVAGVLGLHPYQPGKPLSELEREYGVENIIKLASNENPLGASPAALEAMRAAMHELALRAESLRTAITWFRGNGYV